MGTEYKHYIFVDDLAYIGTPATATALESVLTEWGLISGAPTIRSLDGGKAKKLRQASLNKVPTDIANLLIEYPVTEADAIAEIMGPSEYDDVDSRYIEKLAVLVGSDYRVYDGFETAYTTVNSPQRIMPKTLNATNRITTLITMQMPIPLTLQPISNSCLEADLDDWPLPKGFCGIWRCGLILDCGSDMPAFAQKKNKLPSAKFASDVCKAFGQKTVQIGHYY